METDPGEAYDWEDLVWMTDQTFWQMIAERRQHTETISQDVLEAELLTAEGDPDGD